MKIEDCFYIGYITKTKGLKGEVQVFFEYPEPQKLELDILFLEINGKLVPHFVKACTLQPNQTANIYFEDIELIEQAEKLIRKKVYLPNSKKPERNSDEFLITDLKGFIVVDEKHGELGEIIDIHEYPQQYVAVVPHRFREIMFPLNDEFILEIDQKKGVLHVQLPDGLIDLYLNSPTNNQ